MAMKCEHCGMTTHVKNATECVLCGVPFSEFPDDSHASQLSDLVTEGERVRAAEEAIRKAKPISTLQKEPRDVIEQEQEVNSKPMPNLEPVPAVETTWFEKMVFRRAKGGLVLGVVMVGFGMFGGSFTRRGMTISGEGLIGAGVMVVLFSSLILLGASSRNN